MYSKFYPGKEWLDEAGKRIEAHGGYIFEENGVGMVPSRPVPVPPVRCGSGKPRDTLFRGL